MIRFSMNEVKAVQMINEYFIVNSTLYPSLKLIITFASGVTTTLSYCDYEHSIGVGRPLKEGREHQELFMRHLDLVENR